MARRPRLARTAASLLLAVLALLGLQLPAAGPAAAAGDCLSLDSVYGEAKGVVTGPRYAPTYQYDLWLNVRLGGPRCRAVEYRAEVRDGSGVIATLDSSGRTLFTENQASLGSARTSPSTADVLMVTVRAYSSTYGTVFSGSRSWMVAAPSAFDTATGTNSCPASQPYGYTKPC